MFLFDATPLQSEHRFRGLGTYTRHLALELLDLCREDISFAASNSGLSLLPESIRQRATVVRRGHRPAQVYWMYNEWFLRAVIRRVQPALIHSTDFNGLIVPNHIPTIATLHDVTVLKESIKHPNLSGRMSDLRWRVYFYHKLPRATHIIAISEAVKQDAMQWLHIPEDRITVIPHGVDTTRFRPVARQQDKTCKYLLFVGGRNANKNVNRVLEAFCLLVKEYPELTLKIAGSWSELDAAWLKERTEQLQIVRNVQHLGYVSDEALPALYSGAEVFLLPSLEEGFGLPILECMASGAPVVTSDRGAMKEVGGQAVQYVNPEDVDSLLHGIREILSHPQRREQLIEHGLRRATEFSWRTAAQRTFDMYRHFSNSSAVHST